MYAGGRSAGDATAERATPGGNSFRTRDWLAEDVKAAGFAVLVPCGWWQLVESKLVVRRRNSRRAVRRRRARSRRRCRRRRRSAGSLCQRRFCGSVGAGRAVCTCGAAGVQRLPQRQDAPLRGCNHASGLSVRPFRAVQPVSSVDLYARIAGLCTRELVPETRCGAGGLHQRRRLGKLAWRGVAVPPSRPQTPRRRSVASWRCPQLWRRTCASPRLWLQGAQVFSVASRCCGGE